jgi:hypothetical protein
MTMKLLLLVMLLALFGTGVAPAEPSQVYCGEFSGSICFAVDQGDTWTSRIIIDFSIDEIQLGKNAHVTIYQGIGLSEQDDVGAVSTAKSYKAASGSVQIVVGSKPAPRYFDMHFKPDKGWGVVQVFGYVSDATQAQSLAEFVTKIHPCTRDNLSITCSSDTPFADGASVIRDLSKIRQ